MKKFMKAIAFVTVMCMALSTVAFATEGAVLNGEKILDITVEGAANDQVALVVVASDATDFSNPLYIDQKGAVDGTAEFTAVLTNATVDAVDIYVGYATYANAGNATPKQIGDDVALTDKTTKVTISKVNASFIQNDESLKGIQQTGAGVWAEFAVTAPEGAVATDMIWAIRYTDANSAAKVKYSDAINVEKYAIGSGLAGSIKLALAFLNGLEGDDLETIDPVTITAVDAIFMFVGEDFTEEVLTNEADANNKRAN